MNRRSLARACGRLVALIAWPALTAQSQRDVATSNEPAIGITGGVGGAVSMSQPGFDRGTGRALLGGIELRRSQGVPTRFALRGEAGLTSQNLSSVGGIVSGDVSTLYGAALVSYALPAVGRFTPFAVAGPTWSRASTRLLLGTTSTETRGAAFEQVTHETAPGLLVGIGAGWHVRSAVLRAEGRWMSLATAGKATTMIPVVVSVALPLRR